MISTSEQQTQKAGEQFAANLKENDIVCLHGDLGAGKSVFVRGVARGLGITEAISSPTFTLVNEYHSGNLPLYHFDMYRIASSDLAEEAGLDEYFNAGGICLIEWPEYIAGILPNDVYHITISRELSQGEDYRVITMEGLKE